MIGQFKRICEEFFPIIIWRWREQMNKEHCARIRRGLVGPNHESRNPQSVSALEEDILNQGASFLQILATDFCRDYRRSRDLRQILARRS